MAWRSKGSTQAELIRLMQGKFDGDCTPRRRNRTHANAPISPFLFFLVEFNVIKTEAVAQTMIATDRKYYVPANVPQYQDEPQRIGHGATISAPHMVWFLSNTSVRCFFFYFIFLS